MFSSLTRRSIGSFVRQRARGALFRDGAGFNATGPLSVAARYDALNPAACYGVRSLSSHTRDKGSPAGVEAALAFASEGTSDRSSRPTLFARDLSLDDRVALVTGGNSGIGLEVALGFLEAGARAVYCVDLPESPSDSWLAVQRYATTLQLSGETKAGRLEYLQGDVTDQKRMWDIAAKIGNKEDRLDMCLAGAGILPDPIDCLDYPADMMRKVLEVNTTGVLFTAQAAGKQMIRFERGGSIILIASIAGSVALGDLGTVAYNSSKGAVLQMTRSMACELAPRRIRVNSLSPGYTYTPMTYKLVDDDVEYFDKVAPMGRVGRPYELRGAVVWLASDSASFCTGSNLTVDGGLTAW